jgi:carboxypeptidase Taq
MSAKLDAGTELMELLRAGELLASCGNVLSWDEQTVMPPGGAAHRAEQLSLLAGLAHDRRVDPRIGELLSLLQNDAGIDPLSDLGVTVRESRRLYDRHVRLPRRLVSELSRVTSLAQQAWVEARRENRFEGFRPWLEQVVRLKREEAEALVRPGAEFYDALLEDYEPHMTCRELEAIFTPLRRELTALVSAIDSSGRKLPVELVHRNYAVASQRSFVKLAAATIGFDFQRGYLAESAHPFCSGIGPGDCRLTTRYDETALNTALFGVLHEAGHGIYEQGLREECFGLPPGQAVSLGVHESQSRLWENLVGRGRAFWRYFFPLLKHAFPGTIDDVAEDDFHAALNHVSPSFIRVEADEVTYNLHIMLRFELERALLGGTLAVCDVPEAWRQIFQSYFGRTPTNDREGCLQDIHWSAGLFGYFPTYTLGNLYAAELMAAARRQISDLDEQFARGEFGELREWLRESVHRQGRRYAPRDLIERAIGRPVTAGPLLDHLWGKFGELYGVSRPANAS